jgi:hypothetical protein
MAIALAGAMLIDPTSARVLAAEQEAKLLASDGFHLDRLGESVAVDGDIAIIGSADNDDNGVQSGSAYVFIRTSGVWTEQTKLLPADGAAGGSRNSFASLLPAQPNGKTNNRARRPKRPARWHHRRESLDVCFILAGQYSRRPCPGAGSL